MSRCGQANRETEQELRIRRNENEDRQNPEKKLEKPHKCISRTRNLSGIASDARGSTGMVESRDVGDCMAWGLVEAEA